jgi:DNA-binding NarL/FixJ family response regulator
MRPSKVRRLSMLRILIVDDHEMMRRGIRSVLESRDDIEVYEAENGKEAIDKTHEIQPHLVILDVSMPVLDGFSAAREIKRVFPQIPIIIFSLDRTETFAEVAKKIGVSAYLAKSDVGETLLKAVDAALNNEAFFLTPQS